MSFNLLHIMQNLSTLVKKQAAITHTHTCKLYDTPITAKLVYIERIYYNT